MTIALIDNGSLAPAAHRNLRALAATLSGRSGVVVHAVSWKHSDRIRAEAIGGEPVSTLAPWLRAQFARGEREFVFVPFFISPQGAIASALGADLEKLQRELGKFSFHFTDGLAAQRVLPAIVVERICETIVARHLTRPAVILVDHGGPSADSAALRDAVARAVRARLGETTGALAAASLEGGHGPLFTDQLAASGFDRGDVVVAPLFLAPGRHAGPNGDLAQIARAAEDRIAAPTLRCHFTGLVGTHPLVTDALAKSLRQTLSTFSAAA